MSLTLLYEKNVPKVLRKFRHFPSAKTKGGAVSSELVDCVPPDDRTSEWSSPTKCRTVPHTNNCALIEPSSSPPLIDYPAVTSNDSSFSLEVSNHDDSGRSSSGTSENDSSYNEDQTDEHINVRSENLNCLTNDAKTPAISLVTVTSTSQQSSHASLNSNTSSALSTSSRIIENFQPATLSCGLSRSERVRWSTVGNRTCSSNERNLNIIREGVELSGSDRGLSFHPTRDPSRSTMPLKGILKKSRSSEDLKKQQEGSSSYTSSRPKVFRFSVGDLSVSREAPGSAPKGEASTGENDDATYGFLSWERKRAALDARDNEDDVEDVHLNPTAKTVDGKKGNTKHIVDKCQTNCHRIYRTQPLNCQVLEHSLDDISALTNGAVKEIKVDAILASKLQQNGESNHLNCELKPILVPKLSGIKTTLPKVQKSCQNPVMPEVLQPTYIAKESKLYVSANSIKRNLSGTSKLKSHVDQTCDEKQPPPPPPEFNRFRRIERPLLPTTVPGGRKRYARHRGPVMSSILKKSADKQTSNDTEKRTIYYMSDIIDRNDFGSRINSSMSDLSYDASFNSFRQGSGKSFHSLTDLRQNNLDDQQSFSESELSENRRNNIMTRRQIRPLSMTVLRNNKFPSFLDITPMASDQSASQFDLSEYTRSCLSEAEKIVPLSQISLVNCNYIEEKSKKQNTCRSCQIDQNGLR